MTPPAQAPVGTVALLFTDIEGSTRLARALGERWADVLVDHHEIIGQAIGAAGGHVERTEGDAFFAVFSDPSAALRAAIAAQRRLRDHPWPPEAAGLPVRMGLHVGYVERNATGYLGVEVHRAARVAGVAHGGQLLLSAAAHSVVAEEVQAVELGRHRLKDFPVPVPLWHVVIDGRGAEAFPPPVSLDVRPTNLPTNRVPLVGRDGDLRRVHEAFVVEGERLVTLVGRGGTGKTSLSLSVGNALLDEHPGGVWWVPLATVTPGGLTSAIADVLRAEGRPQPLAALAVDRVGDRITLLVLDNFEHVVQDAEVVAELLEAAPALRVLVTSQVPLRLQAERTFVLDELEPAAAAELLVERAARAGAQLAADDPVCVELARMLDGLPLAIELAAGQLRLLSPAQLLARLQQSTGILRGGARDRPERHRSLEATIDWTLGLLDTDALEMFVRLGVFAAPVELEEVERTVGEGIDVLEALGTLLDRGIVRRLDRDRVRFGMPEALRRAAAARLDASPDGGRWRRAHAERQAELLAAVRAGALGTASAEVEADASDAEADPALTWAAANDRGLWARLAATRALRLTERGRVRASEALVDALLSEPDLDPDLRAVAMTARLHSWAVGTATPDVDLADLGEHPVADAFTASDPLVRAYALTVKAMLRAYRGDEGALEDHGAALALLEPRTSAAAGAEIMTIQSLNVLGRNEDARARHAALRTWIGSVDAAAAKYVDTQEGDLALYSADVPTALAAFVRSLNAAEERDDDLQVLLDTLCLGVTLLHVRPDAGFEVLGIVDALTEDMGVALGSMWDADWDAVIDRGRTEIGDDAAEAARAAGRAVPRGRRPTRVRTLAALTC